MTNTLTAFKETSTVIRQHKGLLTVNTLVEAVLGYMYIQEPRYIQLDIPYSSRAKKLSPECESAHCTVRRMLQMLATAIHSIIQI